MGAARHRAAHQVLEGGGIFRDGLSLRILGPDAPSAIEEARSNPAQRAMRLFIAMRSRVADEALAAAAATGLRQAVILGAGLDTYAYRTSRSTVLRIFEVDHPETQDWKRRRLVDAGIPIPNGVSYVAIDFEHEELPNRLEAAGFDSTARTFFSWLGVVPYLPKFPTISYYARDGDGILNVLKMSP
jgi:methyltransferase (TIGR00027 family)